MLIHNLLFRILLGPEDDLGGGGAGDDTGAGAGADAGGAEPSMEDTARAAYRAAMGESGGEETGGDDAGEGAEPAHKSQPRINGRLQQEAAPPEGEQSAAQPKPHDAIPNTWSKDLADEWKALPERTREQIHKREQDIHNGIRQYKDAAGFGQTIAQEMLPYQQIMRERNVTPQGVVRDIMGALNTMATGSAESKASTFLKLAADYGINLDTVMSLHQRAPSQAVPELAPVLQRVQQLETRTQQADQERDRQRREEEERQNAEDNERVTAFLNEPKNEHARTVQKEMSALLLSGQAKDLDDAYQKAIWLHPEVRQKLLEKQEADRRKKEADEAAAARKASGANVHRRGTPPVTAKPGSMEDTARATYRKLMN